MAGLGFATDAQFQDIVWNETWARAEQWRSETSCPRGPDPELNRRAEPGWEECVAAKEWPALYARVDSGLKQGSPDAEQTFFTSRWSQNPPLGRAWIARPNRGPWQGLFAGNASLDGVKIVNTYNPTDHILRVDQGLMDITLNPLRFVHGWYAAQYSAKPYAFPLTPFEATDTYGTSWALLMGTSAGRVVDQLTSRLSLDASAPRLTRQWAELAFWFPAVLGRGGGVERAGVDQHRDDRWKCWPDTDQRGTLPQLLVGRAILQGVVWLHERARRVPVE
jgi:hypothetical protein